MSTREKKKCEMRNAKYKERVRSKTEEHSDEGI